MVTVYPSTVEREYIVRNGFLHAGMETFNMRRVFLIVLDSVGIGEMPDAADYQIRRFGGIGSRLAFLKGYAFGHNNIV